jgi:CRISPR/Cas system-associated protein Cas7 (RAMP superfamily)
MAPTRKRTIATDENLLVIYEMSLHLRSTLQAHSLSNAGDNGSIRTLARKYMLASGVETDAISGNIEKHYHAALLAESFEYYGVPLCKACQDRDTRRAGALPYSPKLTIQSIITNCGICDTHGFLIPAKKSVDSDGEVRPHIGKDTLIDYSLTLADPESFAETEQLQTRNGEGQMVIKIPVRSGTYSSIIHYLAAGVGVAIPRWELILKKPEERLLRHRLILTALFEQAQSPMGAKMATFSPHLTALSGAIVISTVPGRTTALSPLAPDFIETIQKLASKTCLVYPFKTLSEFIDLSRKLIEHSSPALPPRHKNTTKGKG